MIDQNLKKEACERLKCNLDNLDAIDWIQSFPNTAGPHRGVISGQAFTDFEVHGFRHQGKQTGIKHCSGIWKPWNGLFEELW